jgi:hypothetical protein
MTHSRLPYFCMEKNALILSLSHSLLHGPHSSNLSSTPYLPISPLSMSPHVAQRVRAQLRSLREWNQRARSQGMLDPASPMVANDEDMASTHMTMLGELHGGQEDQQGYLNQEEDPKLIRFESPRWRPKSSSSPPRNPGPVWLKLVTQDASGLRFR